MALDSLKTLENIEIMENYLERVRPPIHIRPQLDIGYRFDGQSIYITEIRPDWENSEIIREYDMAKTTYVKAKDYWKVFWLRGNGKWFPYDPPTVKTLKKFVAFVEHDKYGCFWG